MLEWINGYLLGWGVPFMLCFAGILYGIRLRFFHILRPRRIVSVLLGGRGEGARSSLRSLCLALAGTLGVGNLVGVASAICLGGAGAVFWMWISALCAMLLKYGEILLAMTHRRWDGTRWHGSAMHYIRDHLRGKGHPLFAKLLGCVFALLCVVNALTMGSMIQVHAIGEAMDGVMGISPWAVGGILALVTFLLLRGGTERILSASAKLVPLMTAGYLLLSVAALVARRDAIPSVFREIFQDAFTPNAAVGGVGGFLLGKGVRYGCMRGLLSNEAGCGTSPMAHATTEGGEPAAQGIWGIFEVFADTILLCTVTALVILSSGVPRVGEDYMMVTIRAYASILGDGASYFLALSVLLFGFATVICWGHYGTECVSDLSPSQGFGRLFRFLYPLSVFLGAWWSARGIWEIADLALGLMTLIHLPILLSMSGEVKRVTDGFLNRKRTLKKGAERGIMKKK